MQKNFLRLHGQGIRKAGVNTSSTLMRTGQNALKVYVKEQRRSDIPIPHILHALDSAVQLVEEYDMVDVNDYMQDFTRMQRHRYLLQLHH
jgi:hypothetical protein